MRNITWLFVLVLSCTIATAQKTTAPNANLYYTQLKAAEAYLRLNQTAEAKQMLQQTDPKLRSWEWELLHARADRSTKTFTGHNRGIVGIALSPDGKYLASGSADSTIIIWNTADGKMLKKLIGHKGQVSTLDFSSDGKTLVSGATDKVLKLWDTSTWAEKNTFSAEFSQGIYQVKFNPDGTQLGVVSWELTRKDPPVLGFAKVIDATNGKLIHKFDLDAHPAAAVKFSPDGNKLMTATWGFHVNYHDLATQNLDWSLDIGNLGYYTAIQSADISPDGKYVIASGKDSRIRLLDAANGNILLQIDPHQGHSQWVNAVRFSPDGKYFASASDDGLLMVWGTESRQRLFTFRGQEGGINGLAWHPDGKRIYTTSSDKTISEWNTEQPGERSFDVCDNGPWQAPITKDGNYMAAACSDDQIGVWNLNTGLQEYRFDSIDANCAVFTADGKYLATAGHGKTVHWLDVQNNRPLLQLNGHTGSVYGIAYHNKKALLASVGDHSIRVWDTKNGAAIKVIETSDESPYAIRLTPDERQAIVGMTNGKIRIYNTDTWQQTDTLQTGTYITYMDVHPSGKYLLTISRQGDAHVFDLQQKKLLHQLKAHTKSAYGVAFHPTLPYAVTVSYDRNVRIWDIEKGICTLTLFAYTDDLFTTHITKNGKRLVVTEAQGMVHVYDMK
ncbi:MAG: WD40 repeat domain-containing protein [Saprospiraceae bacterium]|nr:WD40 repeat domain-containing protein [Saprospiraceae bacterium]